MKRIKTPKSSTLTGKQPKPQMTTLTVRVTESMKWKLQKKADSKCEGNISLLVRHALLQELK